MKKYDKDVTYFWLVQKMVHILQQEHPDIPRSILVTHSITALNKGIDIDRAVSMSGLLQEEARVEYSVDRSNKNEISTRGCRRRA